MKLRNFLLIFAVGILLGVFAASYFGDSRTASSPDTPKKLEPAEPFPAPIAREARTARPAAPPPAPPKPDPPKPAEVKKPRAPNRPLEPLLEEAQVRRPFDEARLEAAGCFSSDDIASIRLRWDEFQAERRDLLKRVTLGEQAWDDAQWVEVQRRLREALGDAHYNGLLYATGQANGVRLANLPPGSRAADAGLQPSDRVLSYNGVQVYERRALEALALAEYSENRVEIKVLHHADKTIETLMIEPGPLGVRLTVSSGLSPCQDRDR